MGNDLPGYIDSFLLCESMSVADMFELRSSIYEPGYIILIKLISVFTNNENAFLLISAFLSIAPITYVVQKYNCNAYFSALAFLSTPNFLMQFSALRQNIAMGICFLSILFIDKRDIKKFLATVLFASLFHKSALIFTLAYPAYWYINSTYKRVFCNFFLVVVYVFRREIFSVMALLFNESYSDIIESDAYGILLFLLLNYLISISLIGITDHHYYGLSNILYLAVSCQIFASVSPMAMRVTEYFMMVLILIVPHIIYSKRVKGTAKHIIRFGYAIMLILTGLALIYNSSDSWARAYPYYWLWE